jgi:hypothetical protein
MVANVATGGAQLVHSGLARLQINLHAAGRLPQMAAEEYTGMDKGAGKPLHR